jgi:hypothetical protein
MAAVLCRSGAKWVAASDVGAPLRCAGLVTTAKKATLRPVLSPWFVTKGRVGPVPTRVGPVPGAFLDTKYKVDFSNDLRGSFLYRRTEFRTQCEHPSNRACVVQGVHRLAVTEAYADANTSFFTALFLSAEKNKHWAKWPCLPGLWVGNLPSVCTEAEIKALFAPLWPSTC